MKTVTEAEVVKRVKDQLEAVYSGSVKGVWVTNRKSCPVFIKGMERTPALTGDGVIDEELRKKWPMVKWGERHAHFTQMGVGNRGVKAEVRDTEEAKKWFEQGLLWGGKRLAVQMWESGQVNRPTNVWNTPPNMTGNPPTGPRGTPPAQQPQQRNSGPPTGPRYGQQGRHGDQQRPGGPPAGPRRMISSVICWSCGKAGHMRAVCQTPARERSRNIGWAPALGGGKRGYQNGPREQNTTGPNGKRPGTTGPTGKPTYTQGSKTGSGSGKAPDWGTYEEAGKREQEGGWKEAEPPAPIWNRIEEIEEIAGGLKPSGPSGTLRQ